MDFLLNLHWYADRVVLNLVFLNSVVDGYGVFASALLRNANGNRTLTSFSVVGRLRNLASAGFFDGRAILNGAGASLSLHRALLDSAGAGFLTALGDRYWTHTSFGAALGNGNWTGLLLDTALVNRTGAGFLTALGNRHLASASFHTALGNRNWTSASFGAAQSHRVGVLLGAHLVLIGRYRDLFGNDVWNPNATANSGRCRSATTATGAGAASTTSTTTTAAARASAATTATGACAATAVAAARNRYFNLFGLVAAHVLGAGLVSGHRHASANLTGTSALFGVRHLNRVALLHRFGVRHLNSVGLLNHFGVRDVDRVRNFFSVRNAYVDGLLNCFLVGT